MAHKNNFCARVRIGALSLHHIGGYIESKGKMTLAAFMAAFWKILSNPSLIGKLFLLLTKFFASIPH